MQSFKRILRVGYEIVYIEPSSLTDGKYRLGLGSGSLPTASQLLWRTTPDHPDGGPLKKLLAQAIGFTAIFSQSKVA